MVSFTTYEEDTGRHALVYRAGELPRARRSAANMIGSVMCGLAGGLGRGLRCRSRRRAAAVGCAAVQRPLEALDRRDAADEGDGRALAAVDDEDVRHRLDAEAVAERTRELVVLVVDLERHEVDRRVPFGELVERRGDGAAREAARLLDREHRQLVALLRLLHCSPELVGRLERAEERERAARRHERENEEQEGARAREQPA